MDNDPLAGADPWHWLAEVFPDPMSLKDRSGRYVAVNPAFAELAQLAPDQIVGRTASQLWPREVAERQDEHDALIWESGHTRTRLDRYAGAANPIDMLVTQGLVGVGDPQLLYSISRNLARVSDFGGLLGDRETAFTDLFDRVGDGVFLLDASDLSLVEFNTAAHESLGYSRDEFAQLGIPDLQADDRPEWMQARFRDILSTGSARFENRHRHRDGSVREVVVDNKLVEIGGRRLIATVVNDVTELQNRAGLLDEAERLAGLGSWELDTRSGRLRWSTQTHRIFETDPESFVPTFERLLEFVHPDDRQVLSDTYSESVRTGSPYSVEHRVLLPSGVEKVVHERARTDYDADGAPIRSVGTCQDVTERHDARLELERLAFEDQLTGLPNRIAARKHLQDLSSDFAGVSVLQLDLEDFQQINGIYGHQFGDEVLRATARLIASALGPDDYLARVGGDEFLVIRVGADRDGALTLARRLRASIQAQVTGPYGVPVRLDARVGVSAGTGVEAAVLLQQADAALHLAREGESCQAYRDETAEAMRRVQLVLSRCGAAIDHDEFFLEYQPQCAADGELVGIEALVRWRTLQGVVIPPLDFIPVVESTSLMERLGAWILAHAAEQAAAWRASGLAVPPLAVNVSARQFHGPDGMSSLVAAVLADNGLDPDALELEITESVMMPHSGDIPLDVRRLSALGVPLVVDDFGIGYSSMSVLYQLPLRKLKIDRSLITGISGASGAAPIVEATLALSAALGIDCLAEGVETQAELDWLVSAGFGVFQGFYFDTPLPADEFAARWLRPTVDKSHV